MRMGKGVRTGLGHGGITCVLQTQFSSYTYDHLKFWFSTELSTKKFYNLRAWFRLNAK